jgi:DNA-directed RNA polymerase omega subunit
MTLEIKQIIGKNMARITTEDCEHLVDGRFELVAIAAERTKQLISGAHAVVDEKNDKATVTSLRELKFLNINDLRTAVITRLQKHATEDHSNEQESTLADELMADEAVQFIQDSGEFDMFSEEEGFDTNLFADDIVEDER